MTLLRGKYYALLWLAILVVHAFGLLVEVMDVDAAQYASISMEMWQTKSFSQVLEGGKDYLDKPPFLFWVSSLSMGVFGFNTVAYKLPSFLFSLLGFYSVYRFARLYYSEDVARLSAVMLATTQALFLITNDVRTDTILVASLIFGVWQISEFLENKKWSGLLLGSVGIALAMLTKGPIGLMVPVLGFGTHWILSKQWQNFLKWQWLVAIGLILLCLSPMLWGLYEQHGERGLYFYFWEQSFGRLTGDNTFVKSQPNPQPLAPFFFVHTLLWTFLPWTVFAILGLWKNLKQAVQKKQVAEYLTLGAVILPFIALSLSRYKLPHYIFVFFPFLSVIAASYLVDVFQKAEGKKFFSVTQWALSVILMLVGAIASFYLFPFGNWVAVMVLVVMMTVFVWLYGKMEKVADRLLLISLSGILAVNLMLSGIGFHGLLKYQPTKKIGEWAKHELKGEPLYALRTYSHALNFYSGGDVRYIHSVWQFEQEQGKGDVLLVDKLGKEELLGNKHQFEVVDSFEQYPVTLLSWKFVNPATRSERINRFYIIEMK